MNLYLARNENGQLWLYSDKPKKNDDGDFYGNGIGPVNDAREFSHVTYDKGPVKVNLSIIKNKRITKSDNDVSLKLNDYITPNTNIL